MLNPELRRNLWLEVTMQRLWLTPLVIGGVALVVARTPIPGALRTSALFGFVVLALFWGARQAAGGITEETRARTWDLQRMSALGPWAMTWGKLAGSTCVPWYAAICCLIIFVGTSGPGARGAALITAATAVLAALAAHACALLAALVNLRLEGRGRSRLTGMLVLIGAIVVLPRAIALIADDAPVFWYAHAYSRPLFVLASVGAFAAWSVFGAYRAMCLELRVRTLPWAWPLFAASVAAYLAGFALGYAPGPGELSSHLASAGAACAIVASYVAAFAFARDPIEYRRALEALTAGRLRRALEELPVWPSSALLAIACAAIALALGTRPEIGSMRIDNLGASGLALLLMMLRDVAALHFFGFRAHDRRAEAATLICMLTLDGLLPSLLRQLDRGDLAALVMPPVFERPHFAAAVLGVHAAIAIALALRAWHATRPRLSSPGDRRS